MFSRNKESDNLLGGEATTAFREGALETGQHAVDGVEWLGDGQVGSESSSVGAADEDGELRSTWAVADTEGTGELDAVGFCQSHVLVMEGLERLQVSRGEVVALDDGALLVDDLVDTKVRVEVGLDTLEDGDGAVGASTSVGVCQNVTGYFGRPWY